VFGVRYMMGTVGPKSLYINEQSGSESLYGMIVRKQRSLRGKAGYYDSSWDA
jgi:hypothetical protein